MKRQKSTRKKRGRVRLTHVEVRRGSALRLRVAITEETYADVHEEFTALINRSALPALAATSENEIPDEFTFDRTHPEHDEHFHTEQRAYLVELFSVLCDTGLEDVINIAQHERGRRAEGTN